jgi:hypothetical protein
MYHVLVGTVEKWFMCEVLRKEARTLGCNGLVSFNRRIIRSVVKKCKAIIALLYTELVHILE